MKLEDTNTLQYYYSHYTVSIRDGVDDITGWKSLKLALFYRVFGMLCTFSTQCDDKCASRKLFLTTDT